MPFIFCFCCFDIRALTDPEGTALPRDSQLLAMVKNLPESGASICKPTNPRLPCLPGCPSPGHSPPALSPQSQAAGHWGQPVWPRACLSYSSQPIRNLLTLPRPFLPMETTKRLCGPESSPHSPCLLIDPGAPPGVPPLGCGCCLLSGTVSDTLSFPWQFLSDLLASPDPNNNKASILKQQRLWLTAAQSPILKKSSLCCGLKGWSPVFEVFQERAPLSRENWPGTWWRGYSGLLFSGEKTHSHSAVVGEFITLLLLPPAPSPHPLHIQNTKP